MGVVAALWLCPMTKIESWFGTPSGIYAATPQKSSANSQKSKTAQKANKQKNAKKQTAKKSAVKKNSAGAVKKNTRAVAKNNTGVNAAKKNAAANTVKQNTGGRTPEQEQALYQQKVAEVQRHNAKVAAYSNRDIAHRLGVWGQVGYSAILPNGFGYDATVPSGLQPNALGSVGGGAGIGYQLRYRRFLFTTGAEWQMYNSATHFAPFSRSFAMSPYPTMRYAYSYTNVHDQWQAGYLQIPLLFGMELENWYWQAGAKVGLNLLGSSRLKARLTTSIHDEELIGDFHDMDSHALVSDYAVSSARQTVEFGMNAALAAEIGLSLDRWTRPTVRSGRKPTAAQRFAMGLHYRLALFAEYGVLNIQKDGNVSATATDVPADFAAAMGVQDKAADLYEKVSYGSTLATQSARGARLNPLLVGVKLSVYYELPRKVKKMLPIPKEPTPRMAVAVADAETGKMLSGARVGLLHSTNGKQTYKTTNSKGYTVARLPKGSYRVTAAKLGYYADSLDYTLSRDLADTLLVRLRPEPMPVVYTLAGVVRDSATHSAIEEAAVRILSSAEAPTELYSGASNEDGLFVSDLTAGQYRIEIAAAGYMPYSQTIAFEQDTLQLLLKAIEKGATMRINHLYFATNKTIILPESEAALSELAAFLQDNPTIRIRVTGHTDSVGSDSFNERLSLGRAKSVRADLIKRGVDASRIEFDGKGKREPIATNDTEEGRALNRRVEFEVIETGAEQ